MPPPTRHYDGPIAPLSAPCHLVMPGARAGDGSPSTEGVSGRFSGSVLSSSDPPLPHGEGVLEWENGVTYSGSWEAGLHHGEGAKTHSNGGGYSGAYGRGLWVGKGAALYGGKWGYNKWVGTFVDDVQHGPGWLHKTEGAGGGRVQHTYEMGELAGSPPCNEEYAKACFFRRLSRETTDEEVRLLFEQYGEVDYCYIARDEQGRSARIGRVKFRPVGSAEDAGQGEVERIMRARERAVANAKKAAEELDGRVVGGSEMRVGVARKADMKEHTRYGDY
ncbi:hypothetical protein TeGR_g9191 [Tetraparma gracilis]|uniref:RRM domain-containing protein n=1 Tax=Tetraparma gracilis TaxID=2962635 RepID=A0ABQ6MD61_9STRA|nr:hypothetical protein TeGR_g9191 [Tetraparma gracilis]